MAIQKKRVVLTVLVDLEYDDATDVVSRALTEDWQRQLYHFDDEDAVLAYLAWHVGCRQLDLPRMDGWADLTGKELGAHVVAWEQDDVRDRGDRG